MSKELYLDCTTILGKYSLTFSFMVFVFIHCFQCYGLRRESVRRITKKAQKAYGGAVSLGRPRRIYHCQMKSALKIRLKVRNCAQPGSKIELI